MASPPHRTTSSYPPPPKQPKKRLPFPLNAQPSTSKRRKASATSTPGTSHPLRQTSFPPEETGIPEERSPSVESEVSILTGGQSVVTAGTERARKRRRDKRTKDDVGEGSVLSGTATKPTVNGLLAAEEEEEEEDLDEGLEDDGEKLDKVAEKKKLAVLMEAFDMEQNERHDTFRRVKLKKETVRKIANQTLSQSLPPSVITTINGYTKIFIGNLTERAREVQAQYASSSPLPTSPLAPSRPSHNNSSMNIDLTDNAVVDDHIFTPGPSTSSFPTTPSFPSASFQSTASLAANGPEEEKKKKKQKDLGALLPDHFREALRRYKRDGEGGGTGMAGVSLGLGVQGTGAARMGGKRLFL